MDYKDYISSGIIEEYVLGVLSADEAANLEQLALLHEEIRVEIELAEKALEKYLMITHIQPPPNIKNNILQTIENLAKEIDLQAPPTINKYSDHKKWGKALAHINPPENFDNIHLHQLVGDDQKMIAKAWVKQMVPSESHDDLLESFLILDGTCECHIGDRVFNLGPGDYLDIPLNVSHNIKITSDTPVVAILQRLAA